MFKFRSHHLICNLCFQGKGYDDNFIENFDLINKTLAANPNGKYIQVIDGVDDICFKCPKNKAGVCEDELDILLIDDSYRATLQLSRGELFSLNSIKAKVKNSLSADDFHVICGQCPWRYLCEPNLEFK